MIFTFPSISIYVIQNRYVYYEILLDVAVGILKNYLQIIENNTIIRMVFIHLKQ